MFPGRPGTSDQKEKKKEITVNDLQFIFVHGLSGWGSYDEAYRKMPYWGMRGSRRFPVSAISPSPAVLRKNSRTAPTGRSAA